MKEPFLGSTDHLGERELQLETCLCQSEGVEWRAWHFLAQEEVLREAEAFFGRPVLPVLILSVPYFQVPQDRHKIWGLWFLVWVTSMYTGETKSDYQPLSFLLPAFVEASVYPSTLLCSRPKKFFQMTNSCFSSFPL